MDEDSVLNNEPGQPSNPALAPCAACLAPGYKTWRGDDPKCAFPGGGAFDAKHNWNCGTANLIRDLIGDSTDDADERCTIWWWDDQYYAAVNIANLELENVSAATLWVSWYKHRGGTEAMWLLSEYGPPRLPTEADCLAIVSAVEAREAEPQPEPVNPGSAPNTGDPNNSSRPITGTRETG